MSDGFGDENVEVIEEFIEGDVDFGNDTTVQYVNEDGSTFTPTNGTQFQQTNNSFDSSPNQNSSSFSQPNGAIDYNKPKETAPAMKEYLDKHDKELKDKQKASEEKRQKKIQEAKQSLDKFYAERESKKKTALKNNREHNKSIEGDSNSSTGNTWESVVSMVDLKDKPKDATSTAEKSKDTTRMREILIRLKNTPITN
ncbi:clathrin light chain [Tieghemostelium lacteum]|uniref:Clathrin light chain n=1 Tax=Tieghemostelium lacteum TaxID=361077 RepID=A0A151Z2I3_TIELA|nr:clathrin light chain [Tieghemostelium lacteum]|eukprot:KYQ88171.1 clathrin light chain [Tieghemostelium lacteum]